jgi:branched-subunit amino acid transport protein
MTAHFDAWVLLLAAIGATYLWRGLAVPLSSRIDGDGRAFEWMTCVTYALLAGLISRMIVLPYGELATTPVAYRIIATLVALTAYFIGRRNLLLGVGLGTLTFLSLTLYDQGP